MSRADIFVGLLMFELGREIHMLPHKPPVTMSLIAANTALFFVPTLLFRNGQKLIVNGGMWPARVLGMLSVAYRNRQYRWANVREALFRLIAHTFIHFDGYHLYYNMTSLLWQGVQLEWSLGSQGRYFF